MNVYLKYVLLTLPFLPSFCRAIQLQIQDLVYISIHFLFMNDLFFHIVDPAPYIDGIRINSPHYLCKMVLKEAGTHKFTLVVSQYEKHLTIHYSLRVYSTCPFSLHKIRNLCKHKHEASKYLWPFCTHEYIVDIQVKR